MKSYLHFTPGDTVLFDTIAPSSVGAIFAACLIFFLISVGDRYLRAVSRGVEQQFSQRSAPRTPEYICVINMTFTHPDKTPASEPPTHQAQAGSSRFILSHDLARGALAGLQTMIHYLLMLVVMTFNAAYIISVILGVVVGETIFGPQWLHH
ncbi:Ctr copper transporter [Mycena galopus ATCC 62051]|nr:Ctr copper transporter [Mycena galopus ATCC 62051]